MRRSSHWCRSCCCWCAGSASMRSRPSQRVSARRPWERRSARSTPFRSGSRSGWPSSRRSRARRSGWPCCSSRWECGSGERCATPPARASLPLQPQQGRRSRRPVAVPSPSGHAVLTLPILVPLSDLLGLSRQVTVLAYQYGGGLCELLTPTNGALMAILTAAGVRYEHWLKFALPLYGTLLGLGAVAIALAIAVGLR